jgi:hypothetical protein
MILSCCLLVEEEFSKVPRFRRLRLAALLASLSFERREGPFVMTRDAKRLSNHGAYFVSLVEAAVPFGPTRCPGAGVGYPNTAPRRPRD